jgi:hypothetical protein
MSELKPQVPISSRSTTIVGVANFVSPVDPYTSLPTCDSASYTVSANFDATCGQPEPGPSQPLSEGTIRVVNSVLNARVPESAIRRE